MQEARGRTAASEEGAGGCCSEAPGGNGYYEAGGGGKSGVLQAAEFIVSCQGYRAEGLNFSVGVSTLCCDSNACRKPSWSMSWG